MENLNLKDVLEKLKSVGTEQNIEIFRRHGAVNQLFGVSFSNLKKVSEEIGKNHELAVQLWKSDNDDARSLSTLIADPDFFDLENIDMWMYGIEYYVLADLFVKNIVAKTQFAMQKQEKWIENEYNPIVCRGGWQLVSYFALHNSDINNDYFEMFINYIESQINTAPDIIKEIMNSTLISIGVRNSEMEDLVKSVANKIGELKVNIGELEIVLPNVNEQIRKYRERRGKFN